MKLVKILLASTFTLAAATTFAAKADHANEQEKVVVSTQESPATASPESAAGQPTSAQPGSENAAEAQGQGQPAQPAQ
ncbi:hypothetical protein IAE19_13305 [Acinetobacter sp. S40]|uniref:hypothetical protein n=1 Tax=unclassified Acinetobacter TaxID=196816 RepID=UPI00190ADD0A|nr:MULTISPECIES: hypothetical protein [unclassified Acinetobacter]MBJ9986410.1 hypothetical protein [Acinetobacter sp. S40]MBK0063684.1 hypothetical protein [Acinetobacter sp. S55]MBK0067562.1 hypothetical protein [Acinetobacter sp. S54]